MSATTIHTKWDDILLETMAEGISRRVFTGGKTMLAQIYLKKGAIVPWHSHVNEQMSWIVEGLAKFTIGEEGSPDRQEVILSPGDVLFIPSNVPHTAEALEDSVDVDIFNPPRQDWLDGTDTYFKRG